jgi:hypothetical protein
MFCSGLKGKFRIPADGNGEHSHTSDIVIEGHPILFLRRRFLVSERHKQKVIKHFKRRVHELLRYIGPSSIEVTRRRRLLK